MKPLHSIGMIAPSAVVPSVELALGVERLRRSGLQVDIHPQCKKKYYYFAGTDEERFQAFLEFAYDQRHDILWCARGGYGASRLLNPLEQWRKEKTPPSKKLLVGFSDATILLEWVRKNWGWDTLHAPMPGLRDFAFIQNRKWNFLVGLLKQRRSPVLQRLKWIQPPSHSIEAELVGGNLTVWTTLVGTPWVPSLAGKMLFLEDVGESLYRIDRMVQHLDLAGAFHGVRAMILGEFEDCLDAVPRVMASARRPKELKTLRPKINTLSALKMIFGALGRKYSIPIAYGLHSGHGSGHLSLPLGAQYQLRTNAELELLHWDWLDQ